MVNNKTSAQVIILMGPQGSGKGTQSELLKRHIRAQILSTGEIARDLAKTNSTVKALINSGKMAPEKLIRQHVTAKLKSLKGRIILDGMPRKIVQARWLDSFLAREKRALPYLVLININGREAVKRLSKRKICPKDYEPFYPLQPAYRQDVCPKHNLKLIKRDDDKPEAVRYRLKLYKKRQQAIKNYYQKQNRLIEIDGIGSVKAVFNRLKKAVREVL